MESSRLPRFKRISQTAPLQLSERDRNILRFVSRHRFLRTPQIVALMNDRSQQLRRRLQTLFHHGYLERPRSQLNYYHQRGNAAIVYGLGNKGGAFVRKEAGLSGRNLSWGEKNRAVRGMFLEHAILVSDITVALELSCREQGVHLITEEQLQNVPQQPFQWRVKLEKERWLGVIPDAVFALEFSGKSGANERAYYFLEADRGTMPVIRKSLSQTSIYRKLLAYEATWSQSIHRTKFGMHRFRVLFVGTTPKRVSHIIDAAQRLERGHGLFLFTDIDSFKRAPDILTHRWQTTEPSIESTLLE